MDEFQLHNLEAEEAVIGSIIIDNSQLDLINLKPEDFVDSMTQKMFRAILELKEEDMVIDQLTLSHKLGDGAAYISHCVSITPTSLDCPYYAEIVKKLSQQRRLIKLAEAGDFEGASKVLREANKPVSIVTPKIMADSVLGIMERGGLKSMSWGFNELNSITGGLFGSELVVIGGRPSMGKTQLMVQMAIKMAKVGFKPLFVSLEMSREAMAERLISIEAGSDIAIKVFG